MRNKEGVLIAKAIDIDLAVFEQKLLPQFLYERNRSCNVDKDCFMINCGSRCNEEARKCSGTLTSSNLIVSNSAVSSLLAGFMFLGVYRKE